ncbi:hypothetical protein PybrP1_008073 [[Pythium] brassicae (nom. inval.)]|nr:hypothetical protein PybrP1_008073 [[Pythium] brassicae (nom. inval.)]
MAAPSVAEPVFGKKFTNQLGSMANEAAAADVSAFARRQMEKMGWTEGKGLGKAEQGVVTHVRVQKREEFMGVGVEKLKVEEQKNQWWYNAYDKIANKIKIAADTDDDDEEEDGDSAKKSKKKSKKSKKKAVKKRKREEQEEPAAAGERKFRIPTDEELFAATGGKLFGRRAYGSCNGKLKRDALLQSGKLEPPKRASKESGDGSSSSDDKEAKQASDSEKSNKKKDKKAAKKLKKQQQQQAAAASSSE